MKKSLFLLSVFSCSILPAAASWNFFPNQAQHFQPYLESIFVPSADCLEPCGVVERDALSDSAQLIKTAASHLGLFYDVTLDINYSALAPKTDGEKNGFISSDNEFWGTWVLAKSRNDSQGVFLMMEADWGQGINFSERSNSVQDSLGSLSNPQSALRGGDGVFIPHLSLGYSGWDGQFLVQAGTLDLSNFFDQNEYSDDWTGDLLNESFNYNPCLPLGWANWGYMTAWQPNAHFYGLFASTGTNGGINQNPFHHISSNYWMHISEFGFLSDDVMGLGSGALRLQYIITDQESEIGGGVAMNVQQRLGKLQGLGVFARAGYMDEDAAKLTGVKMAATGGFVLMAPFSSAGWGSQANNEQLALGFLWERADDSELPYTHQDEYGVELSAVVQLTPTMFIQPDVQYIFHPVHGSQRGAFVFQLQTTLRF